MKGRVSYRPLRGAQVVSPPEGCTGGGALSIQCTLPTDQLFNLKFQFKSVFTLEFQPKFSIQLEIFI